MHLSIFEQPLGGAPPVFLALKVIHPFLMKTIPRILGKKGKNCLTLRNIVHILTIHGRNKIDWDQRNIQKNEEKHWDIRAGGAIYFLR